MGLKDIFRGDIAGSPLIDELAAVMTKSGYDPQVDGERYIRHMQAFLHISGSYEEAGSRKSLMRDADGLWGKLSSRAAAHLSASDIDPDHRQGIQILSRLYEQAGHTVNTVSREGRTHGTQWVQEFVVGMPECKSEPGLSATANAVIQPEPEVSDVITAAVVAKAVSPVFKGEARSEPATFEPQTSSPAFSTALPAREAIKRAKAELEDVYGSDTDSPAAIPLAHIIPAHLYADVMQKFEGSYGRQAFDTQINALSLQQAGLILLYAQSAPDGETQGYFDALRSRVEAEWDKPDPRPVVSAAWKSRDEITDMDRMVYETGRDVMFFQPSEDDMKQTSAALGQIALEHQGKIPFDALIQKSSALPFFATHAQNDVFQARLLDLLKDNYGANIDLNDLPAEASMAAFLYITDSTLLLREPEVKEHAQFLFERQQDAARRFAAEEPILSPTTQIGKQTEPLAVAFTVPEFG